MPLSLCACLFGISCLSPLGWRAPEGQDLVCHSHERLKSRAVRGLVLVRLLSGRVALGSQYPPPCSALFVCKERTEGLIPPWETAGQDLLTPTKVLISKSFYALSLGVPSS